MYFFYACVRSHNIDDGNAVNVLVVVVFFSIIFISGFNRPYFTGHNIACHFALLYIWSYISFLAQSKWLILQRIEYVDCFVLRQCFFHTSLSLCVIFVFLFWLLSHSFSRSSSNRSIHLHSHFLHSDTVIYAINFPTFFTVNMWMVYVVWVRLSPVPFWIISTIYRHSLCSLLHMALPIPVAWLNDFLVCHLMANTNDFEQKIH